MEMRPADIGIWVFTGGYVVGLDLDDDEDVVGGHVCVSKDHVLRVISERLDALDKSDASTAAEKALRRK